LSGIYCAERVRSGIATARERGVVFGRRPGQRIKADRFAPKVLKLVGEGQSYREISHRLGLSKNTVLDIVKRDRVKMPALSPGVGHEILPICARHPKAGLVVAVNVLSYRASDTLRRRRCETLGYRFTKI
jgi:hypothetical protein